MVNHIVMWRFKSAAENGQSKSANIAEAVRLLNGCRHLVPGITGFDVVRGSEHPACTADLMLVSQFVDQAALDAYQNHPDHKALKPFMSAVVEHRECMDYQTPHI